MTGYDSTARLAHVNLTPVSQDAREQARRAVAPVTGRLEGGQTARRREALPPRLVVRGSTAPTSAAS